MKLSSMIQSEPKVHLAINRSVTMAQVLNLNTGNERKLLAEVWAAGAADCQQKKRLSIIFTGRGVQDKKAEYVSLFEALVTNSAEKQGGLYKSIFQLLQLE